MNGCPGRKRLTKGGDTSARRGRAVFGACRHQTLPATDGDGAKRTTRVLPMDFELAVEGSEAEKSLFT